MAEQNQFKANVEKWDLAEDRPPQSSTKRCSRLFKKATGIIAGASRLAKAEDHPFFDHRELERGRVALLGFFALYHPPAGDRRRRVQAPHGSERGELGQPRSTQNVANQAKALKPTVPAGAVIDTRTNKMWTQSYTPNPMPANTFFRVDFAGGRGITPNYESQFDVKLPGMDFADWALPSKRDFQGLIQGPRRPAPPPTFSGTRRG